MKKLLIFFSAGCLGALANSIAAWFFGDTGITANFGVSIAPSLTAEWLYPRIVWGGLWGLLFILSMLQSKLLLKGTLLSLLPTAVQLFVIFPYTLHKGMMGVDLGVLTPLFVLFFNWIWGLVAALTIKLAK